MEILLEWVGTLVLLGLLVLLVPVFFMLIITLQFRLSENSEPRSGDQARARGRKSF
ncbi:MAG: hypothetical protein M3P51_05230 [Chloroflexota bacterium]|nr:hypothetical protein [Chloroflexota bacterium]